MDSFWQYTACSYPCRKSSTLKSSRLKWIILQFVLTKTH